MIDPFRLGEARPRGAFGKRPPFAYNARHVDSNYFLTIVHEGFSADLVPLLVVRVLVRDSRQLSTKPPSSPHALIDGAVVAAWKAGCLIVCIPTLTRWIVRHSRGRHLMARRDSLVYEFSVIEAPAATPAT